jgi:hypothetical protein
MSERKVVLNYNADDGLGPNPRMVQVGRGDVIQFRLGDSTRAEHPGCKLRITIHEGDDFSESLVKHSEAQTGREDLVVGVRRRPSKVIGYKCELLDKNGVSIAESDGSGGGEIEPDSSGN